MRRLRVAAVQFAGAKVRTHSLVEIMWAAGPVMVLLNNRPLHDPAYKDEVIAPQTLEVWESVNTTVDSHPIHLHLVQFQVLNRQPVDTAAYLAATGYDVAPVDGMITEDEVGRGKYPAPAATPYLIGAVQPPPLTRWAGRTPWSHPRAWSPGSRCPSGAVQ